MKLWQVRHAQPLAPHGLCYGRLDLDPDPAATQLLARQLATQLPAGLPLRTSPSRRCAVLAGALHDLRHDLRHVPDARLQEMDFGTWEGQAWDAIGPAALQAWTTQFEHHRPGGGASAALFLQLAAAAFDEARMAGGGHAWITHAGVIRAVRLLAQGLRSVRSAAEWPAAPIPFGHVAAVEI